MIYRNRIDQVYNRLPKPEKTEQEGRYGLYVGSAGCSKILIGAYDKLTDMLVALSYIDFGEDDFVVVYDDGTLLIHSAHDNTDNSLLGIFRRIGEELKE